MQKKFLIFAFALSALFSSVFSAEVDLSKIELAVIFRDFPANQDGFEEFDVDKSTRKCAGTDGNNNTHSSPYDQICVKGGGYDYCENGGSPLYYGRVSESDTEIRGYFNGPDSLTPAKGRTCTQYNGKGSCWANPVFVTRDMVKTRLDYSQCEESVRRIGNPTEQALEGLHCARPAPENNSRCDGDKVSSWFSDGGAAKRIEGEIVLDRQGNTSLYRIEHDYNKKINWNGFGDDNGYFPLDKEDDSYGKQSMNIWCWKKSSETYALPGECNSFLGGQSARDRAKDVNHAEWFVNNERTDLKARWHNYNFTMAGFGKFKYQQGAGDRFEFVGDDDMWIFIDGELAADLGGTHLAAPAKIFIDEYASEKGWENESYHAINFFYADRQTDGSNMMLQMALTDLQPSRFGAPQILKASTEVDKDGKGTTTILVNSELDLDHIKKFINDWSDKFPIVVHREGNPDTSPKKDVSGYKLESIEFITSTSDGFSYKIVGAVCVDNNCSNSVPLNSGNYISFNVFATDLEGLGFGNPGGVGFPKDEEFYIRNKRNISATTPKWALNTSKLPDIDPTPNITDKNPRKPEFCKAECFNAGGGGGQPDPGVPGGSGGPIPGVEIGGIGIPRGDFRWDGQVYVPGRGMVAANSIDGAKDNRDINSFGQVGKQIPAQRAGELILTAFPSNRDPVAYKEWEESPEYKWFGLPPQSVKDDANRNGDGWWGEADPTVKAIGGGYAFVKNGFPNESSVKGNIKVAPTRCTANIKDDPDKPRVNCLNFSMIAKQPFQLVVTVYDQMGNFVTQYRETVTEQEFRNVVQAPNYVYPKLGDDTSPGEGCVTPKSPPESDGAGGYGHPKTLTVNGYVNVNVNIYPFSANGRRFGNGVYIAKIDRVDLPYKGCASSNGSALSIDEPFVRYHYQQPFGWVRSVEQQE